MNNILEMIMKVKLMATIKVLIRTARHTSERNAHVLMKVSNGWSVAVRHGGPVNPGYPANANPNCVSTEQPPFKILAVALLPVLSLTHLANVTTRGV